MFSMRLVLFRQSIPSPSSNCLVNAVELQTRILSISIHKEYYTNDVRYLRNGAVDKGAFLCYFSQEATIGANKLLLSLNVR